MKVYVLCEYVSVCLMCEWVLCAYSECACCVYVVNVDVFIMCMCVFVCISG